MSIEGHSHRSSWGTLHHLRVIWKWLVATGIVAILAIGGGAWIGSRSPPNSFVSSFAANLVADAIIAVVTFWVVTLAFGVWERGEQERATRQKALHLLRRELAHNSTTLSQLIHFAKLGADGFESEYNCFVPEDPPRVKTDEWRLLIQSGLLSALPYDALSSVQDSYSMSSEAISNMYRRASEAMYSGRWDKVVHDCLPEFEEARSVTRDALEKLEKGLSQEE